MKTVATIWVCMCVLVSIATHAEISIALCFYNEMVHKGVLGDVSFSDVEFNSVATMIADVLNKAATPPIPINVSLVGTGSDLIVLSTACSIGARKTVEAEIAAVSKTYLSWEEYNFLAIRPKLSEILLTSFRQQPSRIEGTDRCANQQDRIELASTRECLKNLTFTILTTKNEGEQLRLALCHVLLTDCSLIVLDKVGTESIVAPQGGAKLYTSLVFTITSDDRDATLVLLLYYAGHASVLSFFNIWYIMVNGIQVYFYGNEPELTEPGSAGDCIAHMWYLVFFIILLPIMLIISHRVYNWGRVSGRKAIRGTEKDIRAGVHISADVWGTRRADPRHAGFSHYPLRYDGYPSPHQLPGIDPDRSFNGHLQSMTSLNGQGRALAK